MPLIELICTVNKIAMLVFLLLVVLLLLGLFLFFRHPQFGRMPTGERLVRIRQSPQYKKGQFQNESFTPTFTDGHSFGKVLYDYLFVKHIRTKPDRPVPSVKTDLLRLTREQDVLVWFGHSSYFLQLEGIRFLIDPVLSGNASPIRGSNRSFKGSDIYHPEDIPEIDYLLITHDHYDHLDYRTLLALRPRINQVITGLGVGGHLERWGFSSEKITELDWHQHVAINNNIILYATPARHFSGRTFRRNNTLWLSFVLQLADRRFYLGADSGYDSHFKKIGEQFGPFDLALLDNGQYNPAWRAIHMFPEEVLQAATDLQAKRLMAGHSCKFMMSTHEWDEPLKRITELNQESKHRLITPRIGELVDLRQQNQEFSSWWTAK